MYEENLTKAGENVDRQHRTCVLYSQQKQMCKALKSAYCLKGEPCSFHQTKEQRAVSNRKYNELMNAKCEDEQRYYAEKYHEGRMPWKRDT